MKYLFYLGHPAHFHLFKNVIQTLETKGHETKILAKQKDVLEVLLKGVGWPYELVWKGSRRGGRLRAGGELFRRSWCVCRVARSFRPHLMLGTSAEITYAGRLLGVPSVVVNEDDCDAVPLFAWAAYPFASTILAPYSCRMGRWASKTVTYDGYHELAYLHPDYFQPDARVARRLGGASERYFILRMAWLNAHHDAGRSGINAAVARRVIELLLPHGRVYITAERPLEPAFERFRIHIDPLDMHSALYYADLYVGDSQTMAAEAAVLGTPSLRFNDFVGEIGYLDELEQRYSLTRGISTAHPGEFYATLQSWLSTSNLKAEWQQRRARLLREKIDVTAFMTSFIEQYPDSTRRLTAQNGSGSDAPFQQKHTHLSLTMNTEDKQ